VVLTQRSWSPQCRPPLYWPDWDTVVGTSTSKFELSVRVGCSCCDNCAAQLLIPHKRCNGQQLVVVAHVVATKAWQLMVELSCQLDVLCRVGIMLVTNNQWMFYNSVDACKGDYIISVGHESLTNCLYLVPASGHVSWALIFTYRITQPTPC
jgi:hypothetical protein